MICASHASCKAKQQQVKPLYAPYKEVSNMALLTHWEQPQLGRDSAVRQHKEIREKTKKYVDSLCYSGLSSS